MDHMRTALARMIARYLPRPRPLVCRASVWVAAQTEELQEKRRCQNAVLELDPESEPAPLTLLLFDQR
jgi:hypothetical protein